MEAGKHQDNQTLSQVNKSYSFKAAIRLLAPVLFFSVIVSSSLAVPSVSHLVRLFNSNIDKNYVFLLCNGILVLIVKNSGGLKGNSHGDANHSTECTAGNEDRPQRVSETKAAEAVEGRLVMEINDSQEKEVMGLVTVEEEESTPSTTQDADDENMKVVASFGDEDEEEAVGLLSAEELNKKCDDFIRKMKEGIKFEAQQVVMALC